MKKGFIVLFIVLVTISLNAAWEVDHPIGQDYSWTDNSGEDHSIYELTAAGKAVIIFWGDSG